MHLREPGNPHGQGRKSQLRSGSRISFRLLFDLSDRDRFEIYLFPDGAQLGMIWAVGKRRSFANNDLASAAYGLIYAKVLIDFAVIGHGGTCSIGPVCDPEYMSRRREFNGAVVCAKRRVWWLSVE